MVDLWSPSDAGVMPLPSGRLVRGRGLRRPMPSGPAPTYGVYLLGDPPPEFGWQSHWLKWRDFWLPADRAEAARRFGGALEHAGTERVEFACYGGKGRTGTALACLVILDGVDPADATAYVRLYYNSHAVETPWQKRFVKQFA